MGNYINREGNIKDGMTCPGSFRRSRYRRFFSRSCGKDMVYLFEGKAGRSAATDKIDDDFRDRFFIITG